jgi:hypothetical protein
LEKGKEPATKDTNEEPFFDDTKFTVELLRSAFRKLEDVGATFDVKAHHDVYKDPSVMGFAFRTTGWLRGSRTTPWLSGLPAATSSATPAAPTVMTATTVMTAATAATTVTTAATVETTTGL